MPRKLKTEIEHEEIKSKKSPVSLEALCDEYSKPSVLSIHYFKREFDKGEDKDHISRYNLKSEETITYEFDCRKQELKRAARYEGNFRDKGYRWDENLIKEYLPEASTNGKTSRLKRGEKKRAYKLVKRIINRLEEEKETKPKEKANYDFFIRVLKKVNVSHVQKGKQLNLID